MHPGKLVLLFCIAFSTTYAATDSTRLIAGFRASRVLNSYPNRQFPSAEYWIRVGNEMTSRFSNASPGGVWIVSLYQSGGTTQLNFPSSGAAVPYIQFTSTDYNESYLSRFDSAGVNVWLQVEPGAADMDTLISLVLNRYKKHRCVIGFGVDVEWYYAHTNSGGKKLTDSTAHRWEAKVRSIDSTYTLFVKHYSQSWMPPGYRGRLIFVDDSQDFNFSSTPFTAMVNEFKSWGAAFYPNRVAFQFGYPADTSWWKKFPDPPKAIGDALIAAVPNTAALFWVDFTIVQVFPYTSAPHMAEVARTFVLEQNYPNPFNPSTTVRYALPQSAQVHLAIYDVLGRTIETLVDETQTAGLKEVQWNAGQAASGVYFCKLEAGGTVSTRKLLHVR